MPILKLRTQAFPDIASLREAEEFQGGGSKPQKAGSIGNVGFDVMVDHKDHKNRQQNDVAIEQHKGGCAVLKKIMPEIK